jgi:DNA-binding PadR family transcriptional regulator
MYSKELIKGTLKTVLLKLLKEEGRMYGYQMTKQAEAMSNGRYTLTEGSLYPLLHKLEKDGLVTTELEEVGGRTRKYYRLTPAGEAAARDHLDEFREFMRTMQSVLDLKPDPS